MALYVASVGRYDLYIYIFNDYIIYIMIILYMEELEYWTIDIKVCLANLC